MKKFLSIGIAALLAGCASVAVSPQTLQQRTAFALGLDSGNFTISNRHDDGLRTDYSVTTNSGKKFNCYVTGTISITGRVVSDAMCSRPGEGARNPLTGG